MRVEKKMCPICIVGQLQEHIEQQEIEYKGERGEIPLLFSVCDNCGSEQASPAQTRANKRAHIKFKKIVEGLLTGSEVKEIRTNLDISQVEASFTFGGGPVAFSKYESDDVVQSESMDKLLRLAIELPSAFVKLREIAGRGAKVSGQWHR